MKEFDFNDGVAVIQKSILPHSNLRPIMIMIIIIIIIVPRPRYGIEKPWNMKVTIIIIVIRALGTVTKGLVQGLEDLEKTGRVETIHNAALLRSARILRKI